MLSKLPFLSGVRATGRENPPTNTMVADRELETQDVHRAQWLKLTLGEEWVEGLRGQRKQGRHPRGGVPKA